MTPFRHGSILPIPVLLPISVLLAVAGCAAPRPKPVAVTAPPNATYGTILVVRHAEAAPGVLAALGQAAGAPDPEVEFIVREDDGQVVSVIEPGGTKLAPGQRVVIIHGTETRLAVSTEE